jgi:hypothetical protein
MARSTAEEMDRLQLSDEDTEDLWDSPSKRGTNKKFNPRSSEETPAPEPRQPHDSGDTMFDRQEAREAALHNELQTVRKINEVIEGLLSSIDRAKGNMDVSLPLSHEELFSLLFGRLYRVLLHPHQPSSTHGPEFCPKPNTTNA